MRYRKSCYKSGLLSLVSIGLSIHSPLRRQPRFHGRPVPFHSRPLLRLRLSTHHRSYLASPFSINSPRRSPSSSNRPASTSNSPNTPLRSPHGNACASIMSILPTLTPSSLHLHTQCHTNRINTVFCSSCPRASPGYCRRPTSRVTPSITWMVDG